MRTRLLLAILAAPTVLVVTSPPASAQSAHSHTAGMAHGAASAAALTEPGQGAFAALSEVVRVLEADPDTDWSRVDLDGLRAHLVDMDLLATGAVVETTGLPDGLRARATGPAAVLGALRRMVPAHAIQLRADQSWTVEAVVGPKAVTLRVTATDPATVARIQGLGFFGLMASQDHHRAHHLAIARGDTPHGH
ncbi:hypothetical protein [uncultured Jannaschia sp.]|uniref:hypothetical protein n=1 Tax=Jannaschia halovivens TaxID=3388667 RepID=UPI00261CE250|nr:hypothetical protein [uncultured Jannaschia sp.]